MATKFFETWRTTQGAFRISAPNLGLTKVWCAPVKPSTAEINAVRAQELADGWPVTFVDKNDVVRNEAKSLWVTPHAVTVGTTPPSDIFGDPDAANFLEHLGVPLADWSQIGYACLNKYGTSYENVWQAQGRANFWIPEVVTSTGARSKLLSYLLKRDIDATESTCLTSGEQFYHASTRTDYLMWVAAQRQPDKLVVSFPMYWDHDEDVWDYYGAITIDSPPGMEGLEYIMFDVSYKASALVVLDPFVLTPRLTFIGCDAFWADYIKAVSPFPVVTHTENASINAGKFNFEDPGVDLRVRALANVASTPLPWGAVTYSSDGLRARYSVYIYGAMEFTTTWALIGTPVIDATAKTVTVNDAVLCAEWPGSHLVSLAEGSSTQLSTEETDRLMAIKVRSYYQTTPLIVKAPLLANLKMKKMLDEIDKDIALEQFCEAEGEYPALTFGAAEKLAIGCNAQLVHQLVGLDHSEDVVTSVEITGSAGNLLVSAYNQDGPVMKSNEEILGYVLNGVPISNLSSVSLTEAVYELFTVTWNDAVQMIEARKYKSASGEFNEREMFRFAAPNIQRLDPGHFAGFCLMQFPRKRKAFDSFLVAAMAFGRVAAKRFF